jgi:hypothetical protein
MLGCDVVVTLYFIYNCGGDVCCETDETSLLNNCIIVVLDCCVGDGRSLPCYIEVLHRTQPCFIALKSYEDAKHSGSHRGKRQVNLYTTLKSPSKKPLIWTDIPRATQTRSSCPIVCHYVLSSML